MKRNIYYATLSVLLLTLGSCDDMFDKEIPPHDLVGENAITDESSAEVALNGCYHYLQGPGVMSAYYICDNEFRTGLLRDDKTYRSKTESEQLVKLAMLVDNSDVLNPWSRAYQLINVANNFIYYTEKLPASAFGAGKQEEMLAEAHFLRAFGHAFTLRRYGYFWDTNSKLGTIIRMEPSSLSNNNRDRSTVAESYKKIFEDLDYAIQNGPEFYSVYNASATLAKGFKATLLMDRGADGDYAEAIRLADEVIKSDEFGLENTYADIFRNGYNSKELMFTRFLNQDYDINYNTGTIIKMFCGGTYQPTSRYKEMFEKDDPRYKVTFDTIWIERYNSTIKDPFDRWAKHNVSNGRCPMWYLRVAQMYLIKAEAMTYTGAATKDVLAVLNVLRDRAGASHLEEDKNYTKDELLELIFKENVREIGMENGDLFYLAVRMKIDGERYLKQLNENFTDDDQLAFPIPLGELEHNPIVTQKPL